MHGQSVTKGRFITSVFSVLGLFKSLGKASACMNRYSTLMAVLPKEWTVSGVQIFRYKKGGYNVSGLGEALTERSIGQTPFGPVTSCSLTGQIIIKKQ